MGGIVSNGGQPQMVEGIGSNEELIMNDALLYLNVVKLQFEEYNDFPRLC